MSRSIRDAGAMTLPRLLLCVCLLLGGTTLAAGCGGDEGRAESETGGSATSTAPATTSGGSAPVVSAAVSDRARRAYITRVDRVCRQYDSDRETTREQVEGSANTDEAAKAYDEDIALGQRQLNELMAIPPPPGDGDLLRVNLWDPIATQLALRQQIRDALTNVDVEQLRKLRAQLDDHTRQIVGFARGYGFRACGAG